jgi:hypothetical protein
MVEYLVGCRKCEECEREKQQAKVAKWSGRIASMIEYFRQNDLTFWRKGEPDVYPKGETFFITLTFHNHRYPGAAWCNLSDSQLRQLNRDPRFRARSAREGRRVFQAVVHDTNYRFRGTKYVLFTEWGKINTQRLHFHVFFFCSGEASVGAEWCRDFLSEWQRTTATDQGDIRLVEDAAMAAIYAAKYASKQSVGIRIMSSQFNWLDYDVHFLLDSHNLDVVKFIKLTEAGYEKVSYKGGVRRWRVLKESLPISSIGDAENPVEALCLYRDGLSVAGDLVSSKPTYKPLGGFFRCEDFQGSTLSKDLTTTHELPAGCSLKLVPSLPRQKPHINPYYQQLPSQISEVVSDLCISWGFGQALLCKVFVQLLRWYHNRSTLFTAQPQFT